jgi:hypothetical protein
VISAKVNEFIPSACNDDCTFDFKYNGDRQMLAGMHAYGITPESGRTILGKTPSARPWRFG